MRFRVTPDEKYYEPTEARPILNLSDTERGHEVTLQFKVATTVDSSRGNIRLSGLVDMETEPNHILCLVYDGTTWHETSRVVK